MIVIDELKLNKFQRVEIPSPEEYIRRFGFQVKDASYTGEDVAPSATSKLDSLSQIARDNSQHLREELAAANTSAPASAPASASAAVESPAAE